MQHELCLQNLPHQLARLSSGWLTANGTWEAGLKGNERRRRQ